MGRARGAGAVRMTLMETAATLYECRLCLPGRSQPSVLLTWTSGVNTIIIQASVRCL